MNIVLKRVKSSNEWTIGDMYIGGQRRYFTCEDEKRAVKKSGETRIPAGRYQIKFRTVLSEKTMKYRANFPWFSWHLELYNVPGFQFVYIHIGNTEKDSDGCILVGKTADLSKGTIGQSTVAFRELYTTLRPILESQEPVWIEIVDEA